MKELLQVVLGILLFGGIFACVYSFMGGDRALRHLGALVFVVSLLGVFVVSGYQSVPAGYRGILLRFGAVQGVLGEGAHFVMPGINTVTLMDVRTQKEEADASAASKDLQIVQTRIALNFHVLPNKVDALYRTVGVDYKESIIDPKVQENVKAVVSRYTAEELITKREQVKAQVEQNLAGKLAAYDIVVDAGGVSLKDFQFSKEFTQAIETKQVAQQEAEQQKYVLLSAQKKSETAIATAKGEAEANRIKAGALNTSGGQKVLAREWITKWDGKLPTVMSGNGGGIILNLDKLGVTDTTVGATPGPTR